MCHIGNFAIMIIDTHGIAGLTTRAMSRPKHNSDVAHTPVNRGVTAHAGHQSLTPNCSNRRGGNIQIEHVKEHKTK